MTDKTSLMVMIAVAGILLYGCLGSTPSTVNAQPTIGATATPQPTVAAETATPQPVEVNASGTQAGIISSNPQDADAADINSSQPTVDPNLDVGNQTQDVALPSSDVPSYG
jgi:hypothetical protein